MAILKFIPEAVKDYKKLDGSIKKIVDKKLVELVKNPFLGKALGHKINIDLTGFFKIILNKKSIRIVYRVIEDTIEIVEIWGIGKRDKEAVYKLVSKRIK